ERAHAARRVRECGRRGGRVLRGVRGPVRGVRVSLLDRIERLGNKVPPPAIIFAGLCVFVIALSFVLALFDVSATYEVAEAPPVQVEETELARSSPPRGGRRPAP